jgi:hypothetical protein
MRKIALAAVVLFTSLAMCAGQHLQGTVAPGSGVTAGQICPSGTTANCIVGTEIIDSTPSPAVVLGTVAGVGTSFLFSIPSTDNWAVFTSHTVQAQTAYYGATAGSLLVTSTVNSGSGGNSISVQNLLVNAPTFTSTPTVVAELVVAPDAGRGWLMWTPGLTEEEPLTAQIGD